MIKVDYCECCEYPTDWLSKKPYKVKAKVGKKTIFDIMKLKFIEPETYFVKIIESEMNNG